MNKVLLHFFIIYILFSVHMCVIYISALRYIVRTGNEMRDIFRILTLPWKMIKQINFTSDRIWRFQSSMCMNYLFTSHLEKLKLVDTFAQFSSFSCFSDVFFLFQGFFRCFLSFFSHVQQIDKSRVCAMSILENLVLCLLFNVHPFSA